jgi:hypothetical protein
MAGTHLLDGMEVMARASVECESHNGQATEGSA